MKPLNFDLTIRFHLLMNRDHLLTEDLTLYNRTVLLFNPKYFYMHKKHLMYALNIHPTHSIDGILAMKYFIYSITLTQMLINCMNSHYCTFSMCYTWIITARWPNHGSLLYSGLLFCSLLRKLTSWCQTHAQVHGHVGRHG